MRGNPQGHIQNIDAIMETYRSRKLKWNPQLVTFWSKGKQLSKPRPFDWDELEAIKKELATRGSFWVEGVRFFFFFFSKSLLHESLSCIFESVPLY